MRKRDLIIDLRNARRNLAAATMERERFSDELAASAGRNRQLMREPIRADIREATLAVVMILEQHAEVMATELGSGVAAYQRAVKRAGNLRRAIEVDGDGTDGTRGIAAQIEDAARALYDELTS